MKKLSEWALFYKYDLKTTKTNHSFLMKLFRYLLVEKNEIPTIERELLKYDPSPKNLYPYNVHFGLAGAFCGLTTYFIWSKIFYEDYQIRELGSAQPYEIPFYKVALRFMWYYLFTLFMGHPFDLGVDPNFIKSKCRIDHYNYYMKRKDRTFDFMYIGELESFPFE